MKSKRTFLAASIPALICFAASAQAQTVNWNNTGTNFNDGLNWVDGTVPGPAERAVFGATATFQPQLTANETIQGLTFGNAAWNLSSNNTANQLTLTSTGSGTASAIRYGNTGTTISANLVLGGALNSTQQITYSDNFDENRISGVISDAGNNVGLQINYGNNNTVSFSALNTYTGNTTFASSQDGNLRALTTIGNQGVAGAFGAGTTLNFNSGGAGALFQYSAVNGGETSNKIFAMGGTTGGLTIDANQSGTTTALILTSDLAITGSGNKTLTLSGNPAGGSGLLNRFDGVIADGSGPTAGSVISLTKSGDNSSWTLGANNTFSGNVAINSGRLTVARFGNQFSTTSNLGAGTTLNLGQFSGGSASINYSGTGETSNRIINLAGTAGGGTINADGTGALILTSNLTATGVGSKTLTLGGANNGEIAGNIINSGTDGTTLSSSAFASGSATVTLNSVDGVSVGAPISGTGLAGGTTITAINTASRVVTLSSIATGAGAAGSTYTVTGVQNMTALTKANAGIWTLSGNNSHNGLTTVSSGVLNIRNNTALGSTGTGTTVASGAALEIQGDITVGAETLSIAGTGISSGGALRNISGTNTYGGLLTLNAASRINSDSGTLTLNNGGTITGATFGLTVGGAGNTTINSVIGTTTGGLTKNGEGTLILNGASTYTGTTSVTSGTLLVNGSLGASSAVSVSTAGRLGGSGTVSGTVTTAGTGSVIAPGNSPGTLTLGVLNANAGSTFNFELGAFSDLLAITGAFTGSSANNGLVFNFSDSGGLATGSAYTLLTFGSSTGFARTDIATNPLPGSFALDTSFGDNGYRITANSLQVQFIPEPSTFAMLGLGVLGFCLRRKNRKG